MYCILFIDSWQVYNKETDSDFPLCFIDLARFR